MIKEKSYFFEVKKYSKQQADEDIGSLIAKWKNRDITDYQFKEEFMNIQNQCFVNRKINPYGLGSKILV